MMTHTPRLYVPAITPFAPDLSVDTARFVASCRRILDDGADGLAVFGTTSEANSMSVTERMAALEALVAAGIDPARLIPGTGCAALPDTVALTRHATDLGCKGVLMLPPFYYKPLSDDAVFASYAAAIEAVPEVGLYLYHIPQISGVALTVPMIGRLIVAFPGTVRGLKDSSGKWDNTAEVIAAFPQIETFSSSESLLPKNVAAGGAGCISASANVNGAGIMRLIRALGTDEEAAALAQVSAVRAACEGMPLIPGVKAVVAARMGDANYARVRPPLVPLTADQQAAAERAAALCLWEENAA
jgi:4-hydroxy-tetrahydrodipicolinate synthase